MSMSQWLVRRTRKVRKEEIHKTGGRSREWRGTRPTTGDPVRRAVNDVPKAKSREVILLNYFSLG